MASCKGSSTSFEVDCIFVDDVVSHLRFLLAHNLRGFAGEIYSVCHMLGLTEYVNSHLSPNDRIYLAIFLNAR